MRYRVGVVIVSRNHAKYIRDAIASLEAQEGVDLVIRLGDNASEDGTLAIAKEAIAASGRFDDVAYLEGDGDGWSDLFRRAILAMPRGLDGITLISGDDLYRPNVLARFVELLHGNFDKPPLVVTGLLRKVTEQLAPMAWFYAHRPGGAGVRVGRSARHPRADRLYRPDDGHVHPRALEVAAEYLEGLQYVDDAAIFAALCELEGNILHVPVHLSDYRQHVSSASQSRRVDVHADTLRVFDRLRQRTGIDLDNARDRSRRSLLMELGLVVARRDQWKKFPYAFDAAVADWMTSGPGAAQAARDAGAFAEGLLRGAVRLVRAPGGGGGSGSSQSVSERVGQASARLPHPLGPPLPKVGEDPRSRSSPSPAGRGVGMRVPSLLPALLPRVNSATTRTTSRASLSLRCGPIGRLSISAPRSVAIGSAPGSGNPARYAPERCGGVG